VYQSSSEKTGNQVIDEKGGLLRLLETSLTHAGKSYVSLFEEKKNMSKSEVPIEYLRTLVSIANEVLDFYIHDVVLFDKRSNAFSHNWHFITGYSRRRIDASAIKREGFLRDILLYGQTRIGLPRMFEDSRRLGKDTMLVPLYIAKEPVGILGLSPPEGQKFTRYDAYLATCVAQVLASAFSQGAKRNILEPLQFCMLHRRHFLAAMPTLNEVLNEYLGRILSQREFAFLPIDARAFGNIRLAEIPRTADDPIKLNFGEIIGKVGFDARSRARKRELSLSVSTMSRWIEKWAAFVRKVPKDIDPQYRAIFPSARSHVPVPCWYGGRLHGIISVDSPSGAQFDSTTVRALCILGAQAAPAIANAQNRQELRKEQSYLKNVLNAIPDELFIVDHKARIVMMNSTKQQAFPDARKGDLCFRRFEYRKKAACRGCHTLLARQTGRPVRQALWQYKHPKTRKTNYVEISAGQVNLGKGVEPQAVEIVRPVTAREALIRWMVEIQKHLLYTHQKTLAEKEDNSEQLTEWLWEHIAEGLQVMGFPRYRVYSFSSDRFVGKICFPAHTFKGNSFSKFHLSARLDLPSRVLLRDEKLRPILFIVDSNRKKDWYIPRQAIEWNYLTCYLKRVPKECARKFQGRKLRSWVEILIGVPDQVFGKISVDKGITKRTQKINYETAYEMALLATFGRFASVAMHIARHHAWQVQAERKAWREFSAVAVHRIGNEISSVGMLLDPKQASFIRLQCNQASDFIGKQLSCSSRLAG